MTPKQVLEIASEIFNTHPTDKDTLAFAAAIRSLPLESKESEVPASHYENFHREIADLVPPTYYADRDLAWRVARLISDWRRQHELLKESEAEPVPEGCMWAVTKGGRTICQPPRRGEPCPKRLTKEQVIEAALNCNTSNIADVDRGESYRISAPQGEVK